MNGLILLLKKLNGQEKKKKNYCIQSKFFLVNGKQQLLSQEVEHQANAQNNMKNCLIEHKKKIPMIYSQILDNYDQLRLILIQKQKLVDLIQSIWMKTRKKCYKNVELVWQTQKEKKQKEKLEKNNWKKLEDLHNSKKEEN